MPREAVEEYLEAVLDLSEGGVLARTGDMAERLHVSPASVTEVLQRLSGKGLVRYRPYRGADLTPKGLQMARRIKRKHRILEVFLVKCLHIDGSNVHDQACRLEHAISDETEAALCKFMGNPKKCPDGKPIPPCSAKDCAGCD